MDQRTPEWFQARCGKATASRFKDVLATIKTGEAAARRNYRTQLAIERLTGAVAQGFTSAAMNHGTENEPLARIAYECETGLLVVDSGFLLHETLECGASPDGLIGEDGGLEIKCPYETAVHIETLLNGMPSEHMPQVQGAMWITGRQWWDFVSYDPRMPEHLQVYRQRIERNDTYIKNLAEQVELFLNEVSTLVDQLKNIKTAV